MIDRLDCEVGPGTGRAYFYATYEDGREMICAGIVPLLAVATIKGMLDNCWHRLSRRYGPFSLQRRFLEHPDLENVLRRARDLAREVSQKT